MCIPIIGYFWSAVAILSAALFLKYVAFMTLFKHDFTIFSTYSETYINGLQKHMLSFFGFHFYWSHSWLSKVIKYAFIEKSKIFCLFKHKNLQDICYSELNWLSIILQYEWNLHLWVEKSPFGSFISCLEH